MDLKIGDIVRLKSGGPNMTIEEIDTDQIVSCVWFQDTIVKRHKFAAALLLRPKPDAARVVVV
jgi:uncharacterized protein YodC (DUF2158 family)